MCNVRKAYISQDDLTQLFFTSQIEGKRSFMTGIYFRDVCAPGIIGVRS